MNDKAAVEKAWTAYDLRELGMGRSGETYTDHIDLAAGLVSINDQILWPSAFHQLYCLKYLHVLYMDFHARNNTGSVKDTNGQLVKMENCVDFLRQAAMCAGDMSLEPQGGQATQLRRAPEMAVEHVCRDWTQVRDWQAAYSV